MSDTIIENLWAPGDTPSGQYARVPGGLDPNGKVRAGISDFLGNLKTIPGKQNSTAYGQQRAANPDCLFDAKSLYAKDTLFFNESLTGAATSTFVSNSGIVRLSTTTANGDSAIRQTKPYLPFSSGRSQFIVLGAVMGALKANVRQRIGWFDANNGFFFEQDGTNLKVVTRTNGSGSPVDTAVNQASWNIDTLNGSGASGITIDTSKFQIFFIDYCWGGVVRFGFIVNDLVIYCHQVQNANSVTSAGIATSVLPGRFEITNTAATASTTNLDTVWVSAFCEGGWNKWGLMATATNGSTARSITNGTALPILSIRLKSSFTRGILIPNNITAFQTTAHALLVQVFIGGTVTGGAFNSNTPATEVNTTATSFSGGTLLFSTYDTSGSAPLILYPLVSTLFASSDFAGTTPDAITIQVTDLANSGSSSVFGSIGYQEIV